MAAQPGLTISYTATVTPIEVGENPTILLSANIFRVRYIVQNTQGIVYIKMGPGCTPYNYSFRLTQSAVLEDIFQGTVSACVMSGTGICMVTEDL